MRRARRRSDGVSRLAIGSDRFPELNGIRVRRPIQKWREELSDLLLQRAQLNVNTGFTKKLQSLAVVSGIRIHDPDKYRPDASIDQGHGT